MYSFIAALAVLIIGYFVYGRVVEKVFAPDDRVTPAVSINDGVDCVPLPVWKSFLIQLLNIAGTGPIFGALMGAVFGPVVFLWIVLGSILGGAVHDYMCGMISSRHGGKSISELAGEYLGTPVKYFMRVFSLILLLLFGTIFITSPAALLSRLTPAWMNETFWLVIIIFYYLLATLLPIDKLIGRLYPLFGILLLTMAIAIAVALYVFPQYYIPELTLRNLHPDGLPVWPYMFITVACGAISGFHATQSPMVAKCITSEKHGRKVFYGAMISESVIALVWAAAGVTVYGATGGLMNALNTLGQSGVVYDIASELLGTAGSILAVVGVVICPITSGDTAFRSARLTLSETFGLDQKPLKNRLLITVPLLGAGAALSQMNFDVLWRYASWSNQVLAMVALWVASAYLTKNGRRGLPLLVTIPGAVFMSAVSSTYILISEEGFSIPAKIAYPAGIAFALALAIVFRIAEKRKR